MSIYKTYIKDVSASILMPANPKLQSLRENKSGVAAAEWEIKDNPDAMPGS
ncbi:MAG: hypothetical protein Q4F07_00030 [Bacteroidales bacterium]|nr:hypothetical protein [Bacteroidales bacterium]